MKDALSQLRGVMAIACGTAIAHVVRNMAKRTGPDSAVAVTEWRTWVDGDRVTVQVVVARNQAEVVT